MSTKSSAIRWPAGHYFYIVREPVLEICMNNQCAAALVHWAVRWHDYNLAVNNDPTIKRPIKQIITDLFGVFKRNALIEAFQLLEELEILDRVPSSQDRTSKWLLNVDRLQFLLDNPPTSVTDKQSLNLNFESLDLNSESLNLNFAEFKSKPCTIYNQDYDQEKRSGVESAENSTAIDRSSEHQRLVSSSRTSFSEDQQPTANSQQPTANSQKELNDSASKKNLNTATLIKDPDRPETIDGAIQEQGLNGFSENIKKTDKVPPPPRKTSGLLNNRSLQQINNLVHLGSVNGLWSSQQALESFLIAVKDELDRLGRKEPNNALRAILDGLLKKSASDLEQMAGFWAKFDGQSIKPLELPWMVNGEIIPEYKRWVMNPWNNYDVIYQDGTKQIDLILAIDKPNKIALKVWQEYQAHLEYERKHSEQIEADRLRLEAKHEAAKKAPRLEMGSEERRKLADRVWTEVKRRYAELYPGKPEPSIEETGSLYEDVFYQVLASE